MCYKPMIFRLMLKIVKWKSCVCYKLKSKTSIPIFFAVEIVPGVFVRIYRFECNEL